jgi:hypothetical protein
MKSERRGERTLAVEVTNISRRGFWLLVGGREMFLPFARFPWFRDATIAATLNVQRPSAGHLYWPGLDVDLAVESIEHPERFPLVSRRRPRTLVRAETMGEGRLRRRRVQWVRG